MGLLDLFFKLKPSRKHRSILILGLDNAGKTSILKKLSDGDASNTLPTQGFNIKTLTVGRLRLSVWDIGGQKSIRNYWRHYFGETDVLVFVVDAFDTQRMEEAKTELYELFEEEKLAGIPVLLFANKQDMLGAISAEELTTLLQLSDVRDRNWHVQACSVKTGEGLHVGMAWIADQLQGTASHR